MADLFKADVFSFEQVAQVDVIAVDPDRSVMVNFRSFKIGWIGHRYQS